MLSKEEQERVDAVDEKVMQYIEMSLAHFRLAPTVREIKERCELPNKSRALDSLRRLEKAGYITRIPGRASGIMLTSKRMFM